MSLENPVRPICWLAARANARWQDNPTSSKHLFHRTKIFTEFNKDRLGDAQSWCSSDTPKGEATCDEWTMWPNRWLYSSIFGRDGELGGVARPGTP